MLGLISRATSNLKNPSSSTDWTPDTPLPAGFHSTKSTFHIPVSAFSKVSLTSDGHYSKGTVLFCVSSPGDQDEQEDTNWNGGAAVMMKEKQDGAGVCTIQVEARYNSESLWSDSQVTVSEEGGDCGIVLKTPSSSRLAANLSFHLKFILPPLPSLESLSVAATRFRIIFDTTFRIPFNVLALRTSDAPIAPEGPLTASRITIVNENRLDPTKTELKNHEDSVSGTFLATESLTISCANGAVTGGPYACSSGPLTVQTSNFPVNGTFTSALPLKIATSNAVISGHFVSRDTVTISTTYARVEGIFEGQKGVEVTTSRAPISGQFTLGRHLKLATSSFRIDAKVRLLEPSLELGEPITPTPSVLDGTAPPTFEDVVRESAKRERDVSVDIETTDAAVEVNYLTHPANIKLSSKVRSSGGSKVSVTHPPDFEGTFSATTTITSTAHFDAPPDLSSSSSHSSEREDRSDTSSLHGGGGGGGRGRRGRRIVDYSSKKRSEVSGTVYFEGSLRDEERSRSRSEVVAVAGPAEIQVLE
ncbi:hypothetical protein T439DRAFT_382522 [Meredithblackwellia eburnea MCA 4105]